MKRLFFALFASAIAALVLGKAQAWQKDPDATVDPAKVVTSTVLRALDPTLGDLDTTVAGVGDVVVAPTTGPRIRLIRRRREQSSGSTTHRLTVIVHKRRSCRSKRP